MNYLPNFRKNKGVRSFLMFGLLLVALIGVTAYLQQQQDIRKKAASGAGAELSLISTQSDQPGTVHVGSGEKFTATVQLATEVPLSAVDVVLNFDPNNLELIDIQEGLVGNLKTFVPVDDNGKFDSARILEQANSSGRIMFGAVSFDYSTDTVTDPQALPLDNFATLTFKALQDVEETAVNFEFTRDPAYFADSNAIKYVGSGSGEEVTDVLESTTSLEVSSDGENLRVPVAVRLEQVNEAEKNVPVDKVASVNAELTVGNKTKNVALERSDAADYFAGEGGFSLSSGTYDVTVKVEKFLSSTKESVQFSTGANQTVTLPMLLGGNVNEKSSGTANKVDMADITTIISRYNGSTETFPDPAIYSPDVNFDGKVDMIDVLLAVSNYGKSGRAEEKKIVDACGGGDPISYGGDTYRTVKIGDQCWLAENLNVTNGNTDQSCSITRYCYDDALSNCDIYGGLYEWDDMMCGELASDSNPSGVQGICPDGWHLPSDAEWYEVEKYLADSTCDGRRDGWDCDPAGARLAGEYSLWSDGDLRDHADFGTSGLGALPAGLEEVGGYINLNNRARLWSTTKTDFDDSRVWYRYVNYSRTDVRRSDRGKNTGFSVRCIKD